MHINLKYLFAALVCIIYPAFCPGQTIKPWSGFGIEVNALAGKVYKHEAKFTLPIPALTTGVDINLMKHSRGNKPWQQRRGYPTLGLGITYINYGIDSVYGQSVGLYPNITIPIITGKQLQWTVRIGDGIGFITRKFSRTSPVNTTNVAMGSRINDFALFASDLRYHVNKHLDLQAGVTVTHISNASFRKPNLGINTTGAHVGVTWFPVTSRPPRLGYDLKPLKNRWLVQARVGMSYLSAYTAGGPLYPVYIASGFVSRRWISKNKMFAGLDYAYYQSIYAYQRNNEINVGRERQHSWKSAVFAGNEFLLGRVGVVLQVGYYLQESALKADPFYEKVGGNYYLVQREHGPVKELFLSVFLKTHKTVAEMGEVGIGMGF